jgi:hypothetical protein
MKVLAKYDRETFRVVRMLRSLSFKYFDPSNSNNTENAIEAIIELNLNGNIVVNLIVRLAIIF